MVDRSTLRRKLFAVGIMLLGLAGVLALVVVMKLLSKPLEREEGKTPTTFDVARRAKPKKRKKKNMRRRQRHTKVTRARAPLPPVLAASLSGVDFGIPDLSDTLGAASDDFLKSIDGSADLMMTENAVDKKPVPVSQPQPRYPPRARAKGITGRVLLSFIIDTQGNVSGLNVVESEPAGIFDDVALEAASGWRYEPAQYKGRPVRLRTTTELEFDLR